MTDSKIRRLVDAARSVAEAPPAKPGQFVSSALVPWPRIAELRDALDECNITWKAGR